MIDAGSPTCHAHGERSALPGSVQQLLCRDLTFSPGETERQTMTALYLLILAFLDLTHHPHWSQLHPWTSWFVILVLAAVADLVMHRSYIVRSYGP
jgi:hypothetical protein